MSTSPRSSNPNGRPAVTLESLQASLTLQMDYIHVQLSNHNSNLNRRMDLQDESLKKISGKTDETLEKLVEYQRKTDATLETIIKRQDEADSTIAKVAERVVKLETTGGGRGKGGGDGTEGPGETGGRGGNGGRPDNPGLYPPRRYPSDHRNVIQTQILNGFNNELHLPGYPEPPSYYPPRYRRSHRYYDDYDRCSVKAAIVKDSGFFGKKRERVEIKHRHRY